MSVAIQLPKLTTAHKDVSFLLGRMKSRLDKRVSQGKISPDFARQLQGELAMLAGYQKLSTETLGAAIEENRRAYQCGYSDGMDNPLLANKNRESGVAALRKIRARQKVQSWFVINEDNEAKRKQTLEQAKSDFPHLF